MPTEIAREAELVAAERALAAGPSLLPTFRGPQMAEGFAAYRELQRSLDAGMPDQLINISGRMFRKKGYWRAIAMAFNVNVSWLKEEADEDGWRVVYRASTPGGRFADGDGTCTHAEKTERMDTEHNVRSHAHTRAFNRAVSNLVGFGEVSAEELRPEPRRPAAKPAGKPAASKPAAPVADDDNVYAPSDWRESEYAIPDDAVLLTKVSPGFAPIAGYLQHSRQAVGEEGLPIWKPDVYGMARLLCEAGSPAVIEMGTSTKTGKAYVKAIRAWTLP